MVGKSDFNENPVVSLDLDFDLGFVKIKRLLREEPSLVVDTLKQCSGNLNTGTVARRSFESAEIFSQVTGVSLDII